VAALVTIVLVAVDWLEEDFRLLGVLGVNLVALQVTGTTTLVVQRLRTPVGPPPGGGGAAALDRFE
jgi:hypothetical protein